MTMHSWKSLEEASRQLPIVFDESDSDAPPNMVVQPLKTDEDRRGRPTQDAPKTVAER